MTVVRWKPIFADERFAMAMIVQLEETLRYHTAGLIGYVLMPTHLHLLMTLPKIEHLSQFVQGFKILSAKRIKEVMTVEEKSPLIQRGRFSLWKPRFDDVIIISEEQMRTKLNYIHNNPIKAGLVSNPEDYKYTSAGDWLDNRPGLLPIDKNWL
ncbi:MAG: transposase [candidate division Zixibacteria bacterium]|nr:transposase [candidate division Zixibacteria bacterium]